MTDERWRRMMAVNLRRLLHHPQRHSLDEPMPIDCELAPHSVIAPMPFDAERGRDHRAMARARPA